MIAGVVKAVSVASFIISFMIFVVPVLVIVMVVGPVDNCRSASDRSSSSESNCDLGTGAHAGLLAAILRFGIIDPYVEAFVSEDHYALFLVFVPPVRPASIIVFCSVVQVIAA